MYSKKLMNHFRKPHNMGKIKNADGVGEVGNPVCGDIMRIYIKVKSDKITDIKFETLGCPAAIGTSSMVTDLAKGKTLDQAIKITNQDVAKSLGGLPAIKMHCSNLAADALVQAIKNYRNKLKGKKEDKCFKQKTRTCCSNCRRSLKDKKAKSKI
ncbi:MAG: Fe-S cluster assembly scaffold protein NifU [Patescibacteria group bacterium]